MKDILFYANTNDTHYCVICDFEEKSVVAFATQKGRFYAVKSPEEIYYLNECIKKLNKTFYRYEDVEYNGKIYARFVNIYTEKSYFMRNNSGTLERCPAEEIKDLYLEYNTPEIRYLSSKVKKSALNSSKDTQNGNKKNVYALGGTIITITLTTLFMGLIATGDWIKVSTNASSTNISFTQEENDEQRYNQILLELEKYGLPSNVIVCELNEIASCMEDPIIAVCDANGNISFEERKQESIESKTSEEATVTYDAKLNPIIQALKSNPNLNEEEKAFFYKNLRHLNDNVEYLDETAIERLVKIYGKQRIEYNPNADTTVEGSNGVKNGEYVIRIFNGSSIETTPPGTISHEDGHNQGEFNRYRASKLEEGYIELMYGDDSYYFERLMALLVIETFGDDTLREAFYGSNTIVQVLTNKVVEITHNSDNEAVMNDIIKLLGSIQSVLENANTAELNEKKNYQGDEDYLFEHILNNGIYSNQDLQNEFQNVFGQLASYYAMLGKGDFMNNQAVANIISHITNGEDAHDYCKYDCDTGVLTFYDKYNVPESSFNIGNTTVQINPHSHYLPEADIELDIGT